MAGSGVTVTSGPAVASSEYPTWTIASGSEKRVEKTEEAALAAGAQGRRGIDGVGKRSSEEIFRGIRT